MKIRTLPLLILFMLFGIFAQAQADWCATDEMLEEYLNASPENRAMFEQQQENLRELAKTIRHNKAAGPIIIPMVVHVMHDNGIGNISKKQIENGISILNTDLMLQNSDTALIRSIFKPYMDTLNIEFRLARIDPNGNCTEGITRTNTKATYQARDNIKPIKRWPYDKYFNVWLVNSISAGTQTQGTVLGYAQFPGTGPKNTFGIVVRHDQWGSIETAQGADGRTVTHEVGHCLSLLHTFQGGCGTTCQNSGDYVCDTPPALQATWGCNKNHNSCHNDNMGFSPYPNTTPDMLENYMSYDDCQHMFTTGQRVRVNSSLNNPNFTELYSLYQSANLDSTGTSDNYIPQTCAPVAEIIRGEIYRCVGVDITFKENSYNGQVTSWNWSFPGGTPSTSTDSMPVVSYSNSGVFDYSVTVSTSGGSDSITMNNNVIISDTIADYYAFGYVESFENTTTISNEWIIINEGGLSKFQHYPSAGSVGSSSMWVNNYIEANRGEKDALISPSYNFTAVINPVLKFDVAYRMRDNQSGDNLQIWYSTNCGRTWNMFYTFFPSLMQDVSNPNQSSWFTPSVATDWKELSVPLPSWMKNLTNAKLKIEFVSGGGNNFFLDNIRIDGPSSGVGLQETSSKPDLNIYPNPASSNVTLELDVMKSSHVTIELRNVLGEIVRTITDRSFGPNLYQFHVETADLPSGIYMVNLKVGQEQITKKLVIQ